MGPCANGRAKMKPGGVRQLLGQLGRLLPMRTLRCETALEQAGVDTEAVAARIGRSELLCNLETSVIQALLDAMDVVPVQAGQTIVRQGKRSDALLVLAVGEAVVTHTPSGGGAERILARLAQPTSFGEDAMLGPCPQTVSVLMKTDGIVLRMKRNAFVSFVAQQAVTWVSADVELAADRETRGVWLWVDDANMKRQDFRGGTMAIPLHCLREQLATLDRAPRYYCCCRDGRYSAVAAFVLTQRGFSAFAVRDGRYAISNAPAAGEHGMAR